MSRARLAQHHSGSASAVSVALPEIDDLAAMLSPEFSVSVRISNDEMYQLTAVKKL